MLEVVGHPNAVNPDKVLRKEAIERGWPVLDFTRPIALSKSRARQPAEPPWPWSPSVPGPPPAGAVAVVTRRTRLPDRPT